MGRKRRQRKQEFTEEDAMELLKGLGHVIISSKDRFDSDLANNLENAWNTRGSERFLYTVFSHIISHLCDTIIPPRFPTSTISHTPQPFFGTRQPPPGQAAPKINKKDLHPEQIPDFARMILTFTDGSDPQLDRTVLRRLIDFWEIKGLNIMERWDTDQARSKAARAIEDHIEQLWKQARAGFAHNESWTVVYALLIIGPFFSQVVWQRPPGIVKPPTPDLSKTAADAKTLLDNISAQIKEAKARDVPRIEFFNAPVFDFGPFEDGQAQTVSLSQHFLYALSLPLKEQFGDCEIQPSWFDPPPDKPAGIAQEGDPEVDLDALMRQALTGKRLTILEGKRDAQFLPPSSVSDSTDDTKHRDDFDPSPATNTALRGWQTLPPPSPLANHTRRRLGLAALNQRQPPPAQPVPQPAAADQLEDDEDEEGIMDDIRGMRLGSSGVEEEDEEDYADNEETETDDEEIDSDYEETDSDYEETDSNED